MILVADSGSTKTDWRLITADGRSLAFQSEGINPYFHTEESIVETLGRFCADTVSISDITSVYFYAAGCSSDANKALMARAFSRVFNPARIEILHDLLGAARALYPRGDGIAAILGTGSNACLFRDGEIVEVRGGEGWVLGDEGSGKDLGQRLLADYVNGLLPETIRTAFDAAYGLTRDAIRTAVYREPQPNRYLASFSPFVHRHLDHPYIAGLADAAFTTFFERYIIRFDDYRDHPLRIVGSVGTHFEAALAACADRYGIRVDKTLRAPIDGLVEYHLPAERD